MKGGKWSLTCPHCKLEFVYDEEHVLRKRKELVDSLDALKREASNLKNMEITNGRNEYTRNVMINANGKRQREIMVELQKIKSLQSTKHTALEKARSDEFAKIVRDEIGEKRYKELWQKCDELFRPERITDTMKRGYTRAASKSNVTNINKI